MTDVADCRLVFDAPVDGTSASDHFAAFVVLRRSASSVSGLALLHACVVDVRESA